MKIEIVKESSLTDDNSKDIRNLYSACNRYDKSEYVFDEEDDFKQENDINTFLLYENGELAASLNIFAPTKAEAEIIPLTLPNKRNRGYFNLLLQNAREEIGRREIPSILFVCDSKSKDGIDALTHMKAKYEYSEFLMEYDSHVKLDTGDREEISVSPAEPVDKERLIEINHLAFENEKKESRGIIEEFYHSERRVLYSIKTGNDVIGMIGIYDESERKYIYGFCIDSKYQKRGIGRYVLTEIVKKNRGGDKKLVLEVQVDNRNALKLYEDVGFVIVAEFQYHRDITEP